MLKKVRGKDVDFSISKIKTVRGNDVEIRRNFGFDVSLNRHGFEVVYQLC